MGDNLKLLIEYLNQEMSDSEVESIFPDMKYFRAVIAKTKEQQRSKSRIAVFNIFCRYKNFNGKKALSYNKIRRIKSWLMNPSREMSFSIDVLDIALSYFKVGKLKKKIEKCVKKDIDKLGIVEYEKRLPFTFARKRLYNLARGDEIALSMNVAVNFLKYYKIKIN